MWEEHDLAGMSSHREGFWMGQIWAASQKSGEGAKGEGGIGLDSLI